MVCRFYISYKPQNVIIMKDNKISLAPKELAYLEGRAHGLTNKEVARQYGVSYRTVEGAMKRVMYKMHARRVAEAIFKATSEGLLCAVFTIGAISTVASIQQDQVVRLSKVRTRTQFSNRVVSRGSENA